jgi:hypothetical protein
MQSQMFRWNWRMDIYRVHFHGVLWDYNFVFSIIYTLTQALIYRDAFWQKCAIISVTSHHIRKYFHHCQYITNIIWSRVFPYLVGFEVLTAVSTKMAVNFYQTIWRYNPEDSHLHIILNTWLKLCSIFIWSKTILVPSYSGGVHDR